MRPATIAEHQRRGAVAALVALLLIPLLAMVAFAVDIGWIVMARSDLQKAADAAALAGAGPLLDGYVQYTSPGNTQSLSALSATSTGNAKSAAKRYTSYNSAGNVASLVLLDNGTDIEFGYTDINKKYTTPTPAGKYPNTVKVILRLDGQQNGNPALPLFFGQVLGVKTEVVTATAAATIYTSTVTDLSSNGPNGSLLPVAVDMTTWNDFYQNGVNSVYNDPNAPSGQAWFQIYPGGTGTCQNGLLSLNGSKAASQQYYSGGPPNAGWIEGGPTASDIQSLHSAGDLPLSPSQPPAWAAGPGMKSSLLVDFQDLITTPPTTRLLPLFDPNSPNTTGGGNGTYAITYFVPVNVVYAQGHGKANMDIAVVPASPYIPLADPTATNSINANAVPAGESSAPPQFTVPVTPKLSQ